MKLKLCGKIILVVGNIDSLLCLQIRVGGQYSEEHTIILENLIIAVSPQLLLYMHDSLLLFNLIS